ncbi:hypothetical protein J3R30DRAFT_2735998 [Lentinula aciculospora]|uniref:Pentacotripeptide-repeat region of PRORP domain-containing protein n=1 Tax=Lentinula aciculospora TaxID=153920 RepID=A0A9W9AC49_9AGAR|nr:hypothetical protein J3R30DRAFT_2735998 [Lentinula aciculospora]
MLEPVAAVIFNTVLSSRSHLERCIPLHSVAKIVQSTSSRPLTSNFFNPQPRRVKGKVRSPRSSDDEYEPAVLSSRCREWSVQTGCFVSASSRYQSSTLRNVSFSKQRPCRRASLSRISSMSAQRHSSSTLTSKRSVQAALQKRHSSRMAEGSSPDSYSVVAPSSTGNLYEASTVEYQSVIYKFISALKYGPLHDPDEVWSIYVDVERADALSRLTVQQLLIFTEKILFYGDVHHNSSSVELSRLFIWGERAKGLLTNLASRITPMSAYDYWSKCAMARAAALMGQIDDSLSHIHAAQKIPLDYQHDVRIIWSYKTLVFYIYRYYDASQVLTMLAKEWLSVGSYLLTSSGQWHIGKAQVVGASFRKAVHRLLSRIPRPAVLISSNFTQWGPELSKRIGELLIDAYCFDQLPLHALDTLNELKKLQVSIPLDTQLRLIRALVKEDTLGLAKDLFYSIPRGTTYKHHLQTALFLFAHCGDHRRAESYYNALHQQKFVNERDVGLLMHAYGTQGQADRVRIMFNDFFPVQEDGRRSNEPGIQHFGVAIYACAIGGQIGEINYWLEEMVKAGHKPNVVIFNSIMQAFARSGDMASLRAVLDQVKNSDTPPTIVTYVLLMTTLAHRRDVAGVEALYKEAVEERGITPNRRMVNALMNVHVMAGSWKGVIRVFDYIRSDAHPSIRLTIELYTTLLKAYVLIGAPFSIVSKIFSKLEDLNVKPDSYAFALLIQSACDAGEMGIAWEIFCEMDKLAQSWTSNLYIDVYILTIIMAGYLRAGKRQKAKAVYDEMVARQIQPSAVTFSVMLTSYGNQRSEEAMRIAEAFIKELMSIPERPWSAPSYGKPSALELVYGPVFKGYSALRKAEDVERLHNEYSTAGGVETLGTLTALFDAYRRTFQIEKVKEMWPAIFALGVEYVKETPVIDMSNDDPSANRLLNTILCLPLSIYVDALSAAGEHEEIARVWKAFQDQGFSFDAHNWNHLAIALIRAGQLEHQARDLIASRNTTPTTPLSYSLEELDKDEEGVDTIVIESQAQLRKRASRRLPSILRNRRHAIPLLEEEEQMHADDIVYPMHILHQISPAWNVWKIHFAVMRVFLRTIEDLREGYLPRPVKPNLMYTEDIAENNEETREEAKALFRRLYDLYPRTYALLHGFEVRERRRLGGSYGQRYEYGD